MANRPQSGGARLSPWPISKEWIRRDSTCKPLDHHHHINNNSRMAHPPHLSRPPRSPSTLSTLHNSQVNRDPAMDRAHHRHNQPLLRLRRR
jgi:hypothetical protein